MTLKRDEAVDVVGIWDMTLARTAIDQVMRRMTLAADVNTQAGQRACRPDRGTSPPATADAVQGR